LECPALALSLSNAALRNRRPVNDSALIAVHDFQDTLKKKKVDLTLNRGSMISRTQPRKVTESDGAVPTASPRHRRF
jgi:hypothetical protein